MSTSLRRVARMMYGHALPSESRTGDTVPVFSSGGLTGWHDKANANGPCIIVGRKGSHGSLYWSDKPAFVIDTAYFIDDRSTEHDLRWLYYLLLSLDLRNTSQDVGVPGLSRESAYSITAPTPPPIVEQRRIADFLDDQVARLDAAATSAHRQATLLLNRELSEIAAALSGDRHRDRQESGLFWFPTIPSHWTMGRVSFYFDVQLGKMLNEERSRGDHLAPYLRNANVHWFDVSTDDLAIMNFFPHERARYAVQPGDLLICEGGAGVAESAVWDGSIEPCYFSKSLHRARPQGHIPPEWLMFWLRLVKSAGVLEAEGNLATIPHLTGEQIQAMKLPVPAVGEGRLEELIERLEATGKLTTDLARLTSLLAERKQSLITAAVTGQFDVTTARSVA